MQKSKLYACTDYESTICMQQNLLFFMEKTAKNGRFLVNN